MVYGGVMEDSIGVVKALKYSVSVGEELANET